MASSAALRIAQEEWRYWIRSKTGVAACVVVMLLVFTSLATTWVQVKTDREAREQLQTTAEETFRDQPARHPHRMVHYGHYVFRTPTPLAIADPGIDPYTGTVIFLEGHKQNSATFAPQYTQAHAGSYAYLSPALTYQLMVPLLLIVVGFATLAREREARSDQLVFTMAVNPATFWLGKSIALAALALATLLPLVPVMVMAWLGGENPLVALTFWLGYAVYLLCWVFLITAVSAWSKQSSSSLLTLLASWILLSMVLPRIASSSADTLVPATGKLHNDLEIARVMREQGDGHNANDPAFAKLRAQLLAQYDVDSVDALPVNIRGVVSETAEAEQTAILNRFADRQIDQELNQAKVASAFSLVSPYLALKSFSIATASTDLKQHHQFKREAEALRYSFVQGLNRLHANELAYSDDINRGANAASEQRARIDAHHWRILDDFVRQPESAVIRLTSSAPFLLVLLLWMLAAATLGRRVVARTAWNIDG